MNYEKKQIKDLESIIACIYYLSEESYRCGLSNVGLALRASIAFIEENGSVNANGKNSNVSEVACNNSLLELLDMLDVIKKLTPEMKQTALASIEKKLCQMKYIKEEVDKLNLLTALNGFNP